MSRPPRPRLFLSYGRADAAALADRLVADLDAAGYDVWLDRAEIKAGRAWDEQIRDGLGRSDVVVALLSPHAVRTASRDDPASTDGVCLDEISYARFGARPVPVVPVLAVPCSPPFCLFRLDYIDLTRWSNEAVYRAGLRRLVEGVELALEGRPRLRAWGHPPPLDFDAYLEERRRHFVGRDWLLAEIDRWRALPAERALLITGEPGVGKTSLVAWLTHRNAGEQVLAYHCCRAETTETLDPGRFVQSIAAQLTVRLPEYAEALRADPNRLRFLQEGGYQQDPIGALEQAVLQPLRSLPPPGGPARYLLVDALDEALLWRGGATTILAVLAATSEQLPPWLRLVCTSRPEPAVLNGLGRLRRLPLDASSASNVGDLRRYLDERLAGASATADAVAARAGGNFLYAVEVLRAIEIGTLTADQLDQLPVGLAGLFERSFRQRFPDEAGYADARRVLEVVAAAPEPPDAPLLAAATGLDLDYALPGVLRSLGSFLPAREGTYALYHRSMLDWLQTGDNPFRVSVRQGRERLADVCWAEFRRGPGRMSAYALRRTLEHLAETGRWDDHRRAQSPALASALRKGLGGTAALAVLRRAAERLAGRGEDGWDDLVRCAGLYCDVADALRAESADLEGLLLRGEVTAALPLIDLEPDEQRRSMLKVAALGLLAEPGDERAARLREETRGVLANRDEYPFVERCLVTALLEEPAPRPAAPQWEALPAQEKEATPRRYVPFSMAAVLAVHGMGWSINWACNWVAILVAFGLAGWKVTELLPAWSLGGVVLLGGGLAIRNTTAGWLRARAGGVARDLLAGAAAASGWRKVRIASRFVRFERLLLHAGVALPDLGPARALLARALVAEAEGVGPLARAVRTACQLSESAIPDVAAELRRRPDLDLTRLLRRVLSLAVWGGELVGPLVRLWVCLAPELPAAESARDNPLLDLLGGSACLPMSDHVLQQGRVPLQTLPAYLASDEPLHRQLLAEATRPLAAARPADLARALLQQLQARRAAWRWWPWRALELPVYRSTTMFVPAVHGASFPAPVLAPGETLYRCLEGSSFIVFVVSFLAIIGYVALLHPAMILVIALFIVGISAAMVLLLLPALILWRGFWGGDVYRSVRRGFTGDLDADNRALSRARDALEPHFVEAFWRPAEWFVGLHGVEETHLAHTLLRRGGTARHLVGLPRRTWRGVVLRLLQDPRFGNPRATLLLGFLGDSEFVLFVAEHAVDGPGRREDLDPAAQWRRVMPPASPWWYGLLVAGVGFACVVWALAVIAVAAPRLAGMPVSPWLPLWAFYLAAYHGVQFVLAGWGRMTFKRALAVHLPLALLAYALAPPWDPTPSSPARVGYWVPAILFLPLFTLALAPNVVALWRGAFLLYPTPAEVGGSRVRAVLLFLGGGLAFALLAVLAAALLQAAVPPVAPVARGP